MNFPKFQDFRSFKLLFNILCGRSELVSNFSFNKGQIDQQFNNMKEELALVVDSEGELILRQLGRAKEGVKLDNLIKEHYPVSGLKLGDEEGFDDRYRSCLNALEDILNIKRLDDLDRYVLNDNKSELLLAWLKKHKHAPLEGWGDYFNQLIGIYEDITSGGGLVLSNPCFSLKQYEENLKTKPSPKDTVLKPLVDVCKNSKDNFLKECKEGILIRSLANQLSAELMTYWADNKGTPVDSIYVSKYNALIFFLYGIINTRKNALIELP